MKLQTKIFGEVEIDENKALHFENGIIGFPDLKTFFLIRDEEKVDNSVSWLQSGEEPAMALPVMDPLIIMEDYNPVIEDELLKPLGEITEDNLMALVTLRVPKNVEEMSVNLQAPIVINADTKKACQLILDDEKYPVRYPIYELFKNKSEKGGE